MYSFPNLITLTRMLAAAAKRGFAVGAFSPRYLPMIGPVLDAAQNMRSPIIVQISSNELRKYGITPAEFAGEFFATLRQRTQDIPVVLHLDHTREFEVIQDAIGAGFTSVMIDASDCPLAMNIARTREVVEYAHQRNVSVEGELGRIRTTDFVETDEDRELYTDPEEAMIFVRETGVDALAVSVGTAHGVYRTRQPTVDYDLLREIRKRTPVHLVLHGGSGVPSEMIRKAMAIEGGGVSKVNIATDLELAALAAIGRNERMSNRAMMSLSRDELELARRAVRAETEMKISEFLGSAGHAFDEEYSG